MGVCILAGFFIEGVVQTTLGTKKSALGRKQTVCHINLTRFSSLLVKHKQLEAILVTATTPTSNRSLNKPAKTLASYMETASPTLINQLEAQP